MVKPEHISETILFEIGKAQLICQNCGQLANLTFTEEERDEFTKKVKQFRYEHKDCPED